MATVRVRIAKPHTPVEPAGPGGRRRRVHIALLAGSAVCLLVVALGLVFALKGDPEPAAAQGQPSETATSQDPTAASTGSTAPSTGAPPSPQAPAAPVAGQWVNVDAAAQANATTAFFAMAPKPVTGNPTTVPEFHATCTVSHHGSDDPIVFPGLAGVSHNHTFLGNKSTDANSTAQTLFAASTTCKPGQDHSAYWIPTLYQNGKVVDPDEVTVYYGSRLKDPSKTQPFPFGLRMISGDPRVQTDTKDKQGNHFWCAGIGGEVGRTADGVFPICANTAHIVRQLTFPDCWDGKHLDSPDHKAHMANGIAGGVCPASHPVAIPSVSFVISYKPLSADTSGISLSSGTSFSMHGDFFNAWEPAALAARVRNCLDQGVKCNADGNF
jgi:hypothetical protein